jgi:hypothetical protein
MALFGVVWHGYIRLAKLSQRQTGAEMGRKPLRISVVLLILAFLSLSRDAGAGGYMIPHQTARALGLSNAMTAGVNDPSAVYYNPAALGEVDGNNLLISGT